MEDIRLADERCFRESRVRLWKKNSWDECGGVEKSLWVFVCHEGVRYRSETIVFRDALQRLNPEKDACQIAEARFETAKVNVRLTGEGGINFWVTALPE